MALDTELKIIIEYYLWVKGALREIGLRSGCMNVRRVKLVNIKFMCHMYNQFTYAVFNTNSI